MAIKKLEKKATRGNFEKKQVLFFKYNILELICC